MFSNIQREIRRLGLASDLTSVVDAIATSNIDVNIEERHSPASHFSNEKFIEGSTLVGLRLADAVLKLTDNTSSMGDVYRVFGQAIHTVQDFYSHSNWIELGQRKPSRRMGTEFDLGLYTPPALETCLNCTTRSCAETNIHREIRGGRYLTSGYNRYSSSDPPKPRGKCSHGGIFDLSTRTAAVGFGINKDSIVSDHGSLHLIAAEIALAATVDQLSSLWSKVGNESFSRFLGFQSKNLVITLDTTGSMGPVIDIVKKTIVDILNYTKSENAVLKPGKYIFSPFNDPDWGPMIVTDDVESLIEQIQNLTVNGGGDTPELYYHGLYDALQVCGSDAIVFTFTDAPAKDTYLYPRVLARALEINARIYSFYVKSSPSLRQQRVQRDLGNIRTGFDVESIANATGGTTIGLDPNRDQNALLNFICHHLSSRSSLLTMRGLKTIDRTFMVDKNLTGFDIDLSSYDRLQSNNISLQLIDPRGQMIYPDLKTATNYFRLYRVENPYGGRWRIISNQTSAHTLEITVPDNVTTTPITTCRIRLSEKITSDSNFTYGSLSNSPVMNQTDLVVVISCNNLPSSLQSGLVHFISQNGENISTFAVSNAYSQDTIIVPVKIPEKTFLIVAEMTLNDNSTIQRENNVPITPSSISINIINQPYIFRNDSMNNLTFQLTNHGRENLTVQLCASDSLQLLGENGACQNYSMTPNSNLTDFVEIYANTSDNWSKLSGSITFSVVQKLKNAESTTINYRKVPFYLQESELDRIGLDQNEWIDIHVVTGTDDAASFVRDPSILLIEIITLFILRFA